MTDVEQIDPLAPYASGGEINNISKESAYDAIRKRLIPTSVDRVDKRAMYKIQLMTREGDVHHVCDLDHLPQWIEYIGAIYYMGSRSIKTGVMRYFMIEPFKLQPESDDV